MRIIYDGWGGSMGVWRPSPPDPALVRAENASVRCSVTHGTTDRRVACQRIRDHEGDHAWIAGPYHTWPVGWIVMRWKRCPGERVSRPFQY